MSNNEFLSLLNIRQKIIAGYAFSLGIAIVGTVIGLGVGNHYQQDAVRRQIHTRAQVELLHRNQTSILQARTHQQQLIPLLQDPAGFEEEYAHILEHRQHIEQNWLELEAFVQQHSAVQTAGESELTSFIQTYDGVAELFLNRLDALVRDLEASELDLAQAQQQLLALTNSDLAIQFDGISDNLVSLVDSAYAESLRAEAEANRLGALARQTVLISIGLSVAIAAVLSWRISRAISHPIQKLNQTAKKATETANFDLQADVFSQDEIGTLAQSFNKLIASVKALLAEQVIANSKLTQRSQELKTKNQQLQDLLKELHQSQAQIIQSEKMSSLGQLVAGVAHEINNPINFIHGNLPHLKDCIKDLFGLIALYQTHYPQPVEAIEVEEEALEVDFLAEDLPKMLHSMKVGSDRIRDIVLSLRNFSRTDEAALKAVDIHEGIESTLMILSHRLKAKPDYPAVEIVRDYGSLPTVDCYAGQINQVLMNILANAIDALEESRTISARITLKTQVIEEGDMVKISITDNGPGVPEAVRSKIFEPFFTTKPVGQGTGMGMSISYQIVTEKHGGKLDCLSSPDQGTQFLIQLPVKQKQAERTPLSPAPMTAKATSGRVGK